MHNSHIWIVDDDRSIRWVLEKALTQAGFKVTSFDSADKAMLQIQNSTSWPDVVVSDIRMPGSDGFKLLKQFKDATSTPVIIMTAHSDLESAVFSYEGGAFDYLPKPFDIEEAVNLVQRAVTHYHEQKEKATEVTGELIHSTDIIGEAPAMQEVFRVIGRLAKSNISVLLTGASGTGKELVARALHRHSPRNSKPFVALNMGAIPKDLIDSELFGHEKGAFTNADKQRQGHFELANEGTLFLDEIGDMPAETQTRLLRVLANGEFYRVGGHVSVKVNVRIIAATHQDLQSLVEHGNFREDLYHRLNVIRIFLPNLKERQEDIPKLADYFLQKIAQELNVESKVLSQDVLDYLVQLNWPGNVRQLENTCRWLTVMAVSREVQRSDLPADLLDEAVFKKKNSTDDNDWEKQLKRWAEQELLNGHKELLNNTIPIVERIMIDVALGFTGGKRLEAANLLGWGRNTLARKIKELNLEEQCQKESKSEE